MTQTKPAPSLVWRGDLQGLRAIAVVMVLLFHFELLGATGGFAGVDVFFVLSGYLMTAILGQHTQTPAWTLLATFWSRRMWRLAPALIATLIATLILAALIMVPSDYQDLGETALAATVFISNFVFNNQAGYFDDAAIYKPLLHTWSLGVEMQFYLVWPLAFIITRRLNDKLQGQLLIATIVLGYALTAYVQSQHPSEAFFLTPFRIWQFALGAALANPWIVQHLSRARWSAWPVQTAALLALAWTAFAVDGNSQWPAGWGLVPTFATAFIIAGNISGEAVNAPIARLLSIRPMQWLGEISYSLYLVHWPIAALSFAWLWPEWPLWARIAGLILSIPLAWLLHIAIERPMRNGFKRDNNRAVRMAFGGLCITAIGGSLLVWQSKGLPQRFPAKIQAQIAQVETYRTAPLTPLSGAPDSVLLWGDSHAQMFRQAVSQQSADLNAGLSLQTLGGCFPGLKTNTLQSGRALRKHCRANNDAVLRRLKAATPPKLLVIAARWSIYVNGQGFAEDSDTRFYVVNGNGQTHDLAPDRVQSKKKIAQSLNELAKITEEKSVPVLILGQVPNMRLDPARCLQRAIVTQQRQSVCAINKGDVDALLAPSKTLLKTFAQKHDHITYVDLVAPVCDGGMCAPARGGTNLYADADHVTQAGAMETLQRANVKAVIEKNTR